MSRGSHRAARRHAPAAGIPWWRRGWRSAAAIVISAGALAAAVGSVLSLWPDPDPADSARFTSINVISLVPLSEYKERTLQIVPQSAGMPPVRTPSSDTVELVAARADVSPQPTPYPPGTGTAESTPSPEDHLPTSTASVTTDPTPGESVSLTPSNGTPVGPLDVAPEMTLRAIDEVLPLVNDLAPEYDLPTPPSDPPVAEMPAPGRTLAWIILVPAGIGEDGNPVAPEVAAERVVELLGETRTVDAGAGKLEPLGAVVDVNVELEGLRGRPVLLTWSIWQQGGETRLFGNWLGTTAAYQLEATSDHDTAGFDLWVPSPREPGSYVIRLALTADGVRIASGSSQPFN
jgi:hypothetical protein